MPNMNRGNRCQLCGFLPEEDNLLPHLRVVHQVVPGEKTVADVPERAAQNSRHEVIAEHQERELALA